jgi:Immunity protein 52
MTDMGEFYAGAYWGVRPEGLDECTSRLTRFLGMLASAHPLLETWFENANSRKSSLERPVAADPDPVRKLLAKGRNKRDTDGSIIDELGYSAGLWNGQDFAAVRIHLRCGLYTRALDNVVSLELPDTLEATQLSRYGTARKILTALTERWEPDWATWTSHTLRRAQQIPVRVPVVGWMTFLSAARKVDAARLPGGVSAEAVAGGTLITIGSDMTQVSENDIVAVRHALGDAVAAPAGETRTGAERP